MQPSTADKICVGSDWSDTAGSLMVAFLQHSHITDNAHMILAVTYTGIRDRQSFFYGTFLNTTKHAFCSRNWKLTLSV